MAAMEVVTRVREIEIPFRWSLSKYYFTSSIDQRDPKKSS